VANYTTTRKNYTKELLKRWPKAQRAYEKALAEKVSVNQFIHFLHTSEGYTQADLSKLAGVSRERISQIITAVNYQLNKKKGGETA
jgi:hypothetical protein